MMIQCVVLLSEVGSFGVAVTGSIHRVDLSRGRANLGGAGIIAGRTLAKHAAALAEIAAVARLVERAQGARAARAPFSGRPPSLQGAPAQQDSAVARDCGRILPSKSRDCHGRIVARDFDAENAAATVPHREATGFVSNSQVGSGAWPTRLPDLALTGTVVHSSDYLTRCQRRLGLHLSTLLPSCLNYVLNTRGSRPQCHPA